MTDPAFDGCNRRRGPRARTAPAWHSSRGDASAPRVHRPRWRRARAPVRRWPRRCADRFVERAASSAPATRIRPYRAARSRRRLRPVASRSARLREQLGRSRAGPLRTLRRRTLYAASICHSSVPRSRRARSASASRCAPGGSASIACLRCARAAATVAPSSSVASAPTSRLDSIAATRCSSAACRLPRPSGPSPRAASRGAARARRRPARAPPPSRRTQPASRASRSRLRCMMRRSR